MEACDTAGIMDAITAVTGVLTLLVAWAALFSWRRQERQKAILAWKADLVDYAYGFPNLPVTAVIASIMPAVSHASMFPPRRRLPILCRDCARKLA
ncbi:hypothetical protein LDY98_25115, partial [Pseudomonas aeruginosa]|nr:hypothetical protein [Pseudomonas aeruginosa]